MSKLEKTDSTNSNSELVSETIPSSSKKSSPTESNSTSCSKRGRRNTILNRKLQAQRYHSYRRMSPSRFLDYTLQPNPSIYSHAAAFPSNVSATPTNNSSHVAPCIALPSPIHPRGGVVESLVGKERVDTYLDAVALLYYRNRNSDAVGTGDEYSSQNFDLFQYPTLQLLLSPLREPSPLDSWTPREIALFEAGMCAGGKNFYELHRLIGTKSTNQCVEFYYIWKRSPHFAIWKHFEKQSRGMSFTSKIALWDDIEERMSCLTRPVHAQMPIISPEAASVQIQQQQQQQQQHQQQLIKTIDSEIELSQNLNELSNNASESDLILSQSLSEDSANTSNSSISRQRSRSGRYTDTSDIVEDTQSKRRKR